MTIVPPIIALTFLVGMTIGSIFNDAFDDNPAFPFMVFGGTIVLWIVYTAQALS